MKFLVVGCGSIGRRHIANLLTLKAGEVIAYDTDAARASEAAKTHGIRAFNTLDEALRQKPDAALICTPTNLHVDAAVKCLEAGANLFIEKPVAVSLEQAWRIIPAARGKVVLTGCNMRFHPGVEAVQKSVAAGDIGKPLFFKAWFSHYLPNWRPGADYRKTYSARASEGGGIILECLHEIDYLRWMGGEAAVAESFADKVSDLEIDSEDTALTVLKFDSGAVGLIVADYLNPVKRRGCEVLGENGTLVWESEGKSPEKVLVRRYDAATSTWETLLHKEAYDGNMMYLHEMNHFLECLTNQEKPASNLENGCRALELALAAREKGSLLAGGKRV
jgi:predicted dehydrogenase